MGFFDKIKKSLTRTKEQFVERFEEVVKRADEPATRSQPIDVETMDALEEALISADVGVAATEQIVQAVREKRGGGRSLRGLVKEEIRDILRGANPPAGNGHRPHVVLIVGVNGTGKTTTVGKLARLIKESGKDPLICAADTFRAAAVEQLEIWAKRAGVDIIRARTGADPAAVVYDAIAAGKSRDRDVVIVGVNGTGKTTTVGKLARLIKDSGKDPLICAADTFRAAAVEQLEIWAKRAGVDIIRARTGADPAAVVYDAIAAGKSRDRDVVIVDTAGRLHTRTNLMNELDKIRRVAAREIEGAPHEVLLVLDATVGQNGLAQAREFMNVAGVNGIVLTKLDGTAKGGIAVAIAHDLKLPIRYVGVGESIDDLVPFSPDEYVDALFEEKW